jgi:D-amino peptidase
MRVHVISDMEGVSGIVKAEQTTGGAPLYEEGRKLYTEEINAAVRGAKAAGATEIVVMDCHGAGGEFTFNSLVPELLDPACDWVVQDEWTEYTAFLESGCDAALFVGMHAKAGTRDGGLNHTVSGSDWQTLWFNGVEVGETGINAALCGTWGCPVVLVTGDTAVCREATELLGDGLVTVAVKESYGVQSARLIAPSRARALIEEGATKALSGLGSGAVRPWNPGSPAEIRVEFKRTGLPDRLRFRPGVERLDGRTIVSRAETWWDAWKQFFF